MQKILLLLLFMAGAGALQAQSLKELLYGGKLKSDSNAVVRNTDDLKSKIDTGQKKPVVAPAEKVMAVTHADSAKQLTLQKEPAAAVAAIPDSAATAEVAEAPVTAAAPVKTNTKIWKEYTDSLVAALKPEVDNAKKIKKETYYVLVAYEIDTSGQVNVNTVTITPSNEMLHAQVRQYLDVTPPRLNPVLDSGHQPRKVKRSGSFTITKE